MHENCYIAVDLGGTKLHVAKVIGTQVFTAEKFLLQENTLQSTHSKASVYDPCEHLIHLLIHAIEQNLCDQVEAIGIGVPGLVNSETGVVSDLINIPYWHNVPLQEILQQQFKRPVFINNDANCFMLGEALYGEAKGVKNAVSLCLGTGTGVGLLLNGQLYFGSHCGAGELGELPYLKSNFEAYTSGQFFTHYYQQSGEELYKRALQGDVPAKSAFEKYGHHLAQAIKTLLLTFDPEMIVICGSVSRAWPLFREALHKELANFQFGSVLESLEVKVSTNPYSALLGASSLCNPAFKNMTHVNHLSLPQSA